MRAPRRQSNLQLKPRRLDQRRQFAIRLKLGTLPSFLSAADQKTPPVSSLAVPDGVITPFVLFPSQTLTLKPRPTGTMKKTSNLVRHPPRRSQRRPERCSRQLDLQTLPQRQRRPLQGLQRHRNIARVEQPVESGTAGMHPLGHGRFGKGWPLSSPARSARQSPA